MAAMKFIAVIVLLALLGVAQAADWAVIVAGSNTFGINIVHRDGLNASRVSITHAYEYQAC
jgi:uncharacterized membrane protein YecN with MAPEG domain